MINRAEVLSAKPAEHVLSEGFLDKKSSAG